MPRLPVNRFGRTGLPVETSVFAVTAEVKSAVRLVCVNRHAARRGLTSGMTLATARAISPDLLSVEEDPERDQFFLKALQRWTEKFTPWSTYAGKDELLLNISGCAHLFGGEEAMAEQITLALTDMQVESRIGIADTKGAARAAAHYGPHRHTLLGIGKTRQALAAYPIDALFTDEKTLFSLKRLGLKHISDMYPLKSADLARRFGFSLLKTYEKMLGSETDPVTPAKAQASFSARLSFPDPIGLADDISAALGRLTTQVCKRLEEASFGARTLRLSCYRTDRQQIHLDIGLARPSQEPKSIIRQFTLKLDRIDAGCGIDMMRLVALKAEPFKPAQHQFADAERRSSLDDLISTLGNQIGFDRVLRWQPVDSHLPQASYRFIEAVQYTNQCEWYAADRPLTLLEGEPVDILEAGRPPRKFQWRQAAYTTARHEGPERIGHEWWTNNAGTTRDYWRVDCLEGPRLWLATAPGQQPAQWEVAGVFP